MDFKRIAWNPNLISRENRYTFLKDRYGWRSGEITVQQARDIEKIIKEHFINCEFRGTNPISDSYLTDPYKFTINLMVIFDTLGDDVHFAFLLDSNVITLDD